jgi:hypothetical protein
MAWQIPESHMPASVAAQSTAQNVLKSVEYELARLATNLQGNYTVARYSATESDTELERALEKEKWQRRRNPLHHFYR